MKKLIIILMLPLAFSSARAQLLSNTRSSAMMESDSAVFNIDFINTFGLPGFEVSIRARSGMGNEEYSIPLSPLDDPPYYENTYAGSWVFEEPGSSLSFYGRVDAETLVISQSYENTGNQMPPDNIFYAELAPDPVGDTLPGTSGGWLDLTGTAATYSDTRLYARLSNAYNQWPINYGQEFYFYGFLMHPADTLSLYLTAMVYGNIPFFFEPGLYTLSLVDSTFERLADIQYDASQYLHMSCAIEDLLSAPGWDTWPPENGFVLTGGVTFTVSFLTPIFNDFTYPSAFVPETQYLATNENAPPELEWEISPIPDEYVDAYVLYSDPDNNLPVEKTLYFDGEAYEMGSYDRDYTDMALFEHQLEWPGGGWHTFYFRFSDGAAVVETELDSVYLSGISVDEEVTPSRLGLSQNYPNPFNAKTSIKFELAEPSHVNLAVYGISGGLVAVLENSYLQSGAHSVIWDGRNNAGQPVSSGVYFYKLSSEGYSDTRRMLLLK